MQLTFATAAAVLTFTAAPALAVDQRFMTSCANKSGAVYNAIERFCSACQSEHGCTVPSSWSEGGETSHTLPGNKPFDHEAIIYIRDKGCTGKPAANAKPEKLSKDNCLQRFYRMCAMSTEKRGIALMEWNCAQYEISVTGDSTQKPLIPAWGGKHPQNPRKHKKNGNKKSSGHKKGKHPHKKNAHKKHN